ncbi:MAG TPA: right-handed parallel beta-helix repeat-containing protein, partial [Polyangiaceae bacterium]|nr:right-handed parallel beta-helix repeat-containing protein [Polyangiaceae bacterium]
RGAAWCAAVASIAGTVHAASTDLGPTDDVEMAINMLQPGDELVLQGGDYTLTDAWHIAVAGTQAAPIVVRAKDGEVPLLNRPAVDQNIVDFDDVQYLTIKGIRFSGGSAGLRFINANFVTVQDCEVFNTADVAISANSGMDYQGLSIIHNHLHNTGGTGEGMYIGCNDNGCRVHDSLFANNYIHDTKGPNVSQGDGIEIKEGSYNNVVRGNVIHDTGYPCIITYSTVGNGAPNVIEGNLLWNCGDHGIQSAADVIIRNNIILGAASNGIANQPHQAGTPANIQILHNTILAPQNDAIASTGITGSVVIANNAVYAAQGNAIRVAGDLTGVIVSGNVGEGALSGVMTGLAPGSLANDFVSASYSGALPNDVFPTAASALIAAGDPQYAVMDDFNGTPRAGSIDVGAYLYAAMNPGSPLADDFKAETPGINMGVGGNTNAGGTVGTGGTPSADGGTTMPPPNGGTGAANTGGTTATNHAGSGDTHNAAGAPAISSGGASGGTTATNHTATNSGTTSPTTNTTSGCGCALTPRASSPWPLLSWAALMFLRRSRKK